METSRSDLIDDLTADLTPVKSVNTRISSVYWLLSAFALSVSILWLTGPFRADSFHDLLHSPQFLIENIIGVIAIAAVIYTAFEWTIPSPKNTFSRLVWPLLAILLWVGFYLFGLFSPALEPSMMGKREFCYYETFIFAIPALVIGLVWARKQWPLHSAVTGGLIGLAAGLVPALIMQFACMYDPSHILTEHILPGLSVGLLGTVLGIFFLKQR